MSRIFHFRTSFLMIVTSALMVAPAALGQDVASIMPGLRWADAPCETPLMITHIPSSPTACSGDSLSATVDCVLGLAGYAFSEAGQQAIATAFYAGDTDFLTSTALDVAPSLNFADIRPGQVIPVYVGDGEGFGEVLELHLHVPSDLRLLLLTGDGFVDLGTSYALDVAAYRVSGALAPIVIQRIGTSAGCSGPGWDCNPSGTLEPCTRDDDLECGPEFPSPPPCDDGDRCTDDIIRFGPFPDPTWYQCCHAPTSCDDHSACTDDGCDSATGCYHTDIVCHDDDLCTLDCCDYTTGCYYPLIINCDDGNPCTDDSCDPETGECVHTPACDDGLLCTIDSCDPETGDCSNTLKDCDDHDDCTIDSCDPETGECVHEDKDCDDSDPCTIDDCDCDTGDCTHECGIHGHISCRTNYDRIPPGETVPLALIPSAPDECPACDRVSFWEEDSACVDLSYDGCAATLVVGHDCYEDTEVTVTVHFWNCDKTVQRTFEIGCGNECSSCAGGDAGRLTAELGSVSLAISMGRADRERSAGTLRIRSECLDPDRILANPAAIEYSHSPSPPPGVVPVWTGDPPVLRQIATPEVLADFCTNDDADFYRMEIEYLYSEGVEWNAELGLYEGGTSFVRYELVQPVEDLGQLSVTKFVDGAAVARYDYERTPGTCDWTLITNGMNGTTPVPLKRESCTWAYNSGDDTYERTQTTELQVGVGTEEWALARREITVHPGSRDAAWIRKTVDTDGAPEHALVTRRSYRPEGGPTAVS